MAKQHKTVVFRIQLTLDAKKKLLEVSEQLGMTQISITSKLVEFMAKQETEIQAELMGIYPKSLRQDIAKTLLARKGK